MNSESSTTNAQSQNILASQPAALQSECYVAASPMTEVMFDQLEYLLAHTAERANRGQQCAPECMDCGRLQQVKNWLLLPFHSAMHPPVQ
jgi:hypothetical protein